MRKNVPLLGFPPPLLDPPWRLPADAVPYYRTLTRIPPELLLDVAGRELTLCQGERCLVGWAVRDALAELLQTDPENVRASTTVLPGAKLPEHMTPERAAMLFGGSAEEWDRVFMGVAHYDSVWQRENETREEATEHRAKEAAIEHAFTAAVARAAALVEVDG